MTTVTLITVFSEVPQNGGGFKCRALVSVQANDGASINVEINGLWVSNLVTLQGVLSEMALNSLAKQEECFYIREIEEGRNPFTSPARFNANQELLRSLIRRIVSINDPSDRFVYNGMALIDGISDVQLQNLFPTLTEEKITQIRNRVAKMLSIKNEFNSYSGMEI